MIWTESGDTAARIMELNGVLGKPDVPVTLLDTPSFPKDAPALFCASVSLYDLILP